MINPAPTASDHHSLPYRSVGVIIHDALKQCQNQSYVVDSNGDEINYQTLLKMTVALAKKLKDLGVKKGDVMSIVSHNQVNCLVTIIAGFYVGAKVNLLNYDYTSRELENLLDICRPVFIFCVAKALPIILELKEELSNPAIVLYDDEPVLSEVTNFKDLIANLEDDSDFAPLDLNIKEDVALVMVSSGTTGFPKCVQLTHSNLRVSMWYVTSPDYIDVPGSKALVCYLPLYHIFGTLLSLGAILSRIKLLLTHKFVPDSFLKTLQEHKITTLYAVPPVLLFLVKSPLVQKYDISSLASVFCGAAALSKDLQEAVEERLRVTVRQLYGMTEAGGAVTCASNQRKKPGSVGKPIASFALKVCDPETGRELAENQVGEIRIAGEGVMKNYLGNDEQTREAFDDEGYLRSGDLGFRDADGCFFIVDRLKELIKYKGFQVAPAELESLLVRHPAVKDAGVVGKPDERAGEVAVAFVVKQEKQEVTEEELLKYVAENLSLQKHLHGGVRFVAEIPKNPSGKILRRELRRFV